MKDLCKCFHFINQKRVSIKYLKWKQNKKAASLKDTAGKFYDGNCSGKNFLDLVCCLLKLNGRMYCQPGIVQDFLGELRIGAL